jgi:cell division protein FtsB
MIYSHQSRKRKKNSSIKFWLILIVALFFLVFLGQAGWGVWQKEKQLGQTLEALKEQAEALEKEKEELEERIAAVDQPAYLEEVGREELNLKKPEEKVVALVQSSTDPIQEEAPSLNWWQKTKKIIKEWFSFKR